MADALALTEKDVVCVNINDFVKSQQTGRLKEMLSGFVCSKNSDVASFLKDRALSFTQQKFSVTYLVFAKEINRLLGYFALATKALFIPQADLDRFKKSLNHSQKYRLQRMCAPMSDPDLVTSTEQTEGWLLPVFLVAQLGKNDAGLPDQFAGKLLLDFAMSEIYKAQRIMGDRVALVEAEPMDKLISFYEKNGFVRFKTRDNAGGKHLVQLMRIL